MNTQFDLDFVVKSTEGTLLHQGPLSFTGIGTDTRKDLEGQLFIALKGENFDAHDFLSAALDAGATGLLVTHLPEDLAARAQKVSVVKVDDTLTALQRLAHTWRMRSKARFIAITGSNGKTTTKGFCDTILSQNYKTVSSHGSFNNHWGVPLTLLTVKPDTEMAVVEMGMNHAGELTTLARIAKPDVAIVTTVGRSHIGYFGSEEKIAQAKEELYLESPKAVHVFNLDNSYTREMWERQKSKPGSGGIKTFSSFKSDADVHMRVIRTGMDHIEVSGHIGNVPGAATVPVFGRQNVVNLMAASALALSVGMPPEEIWKALPKCRTGWGRNQVIQLPSGASVLFDAYNANPESMAALIKNIFEIPSRRLKVMVLGEMLELGDQAEVLHEQLGEMVGNTDVDLIWFIGPSKEAFKRGIERGDFKKSLYLSNTYEEVLALKIGSMIDSQDIIVVKG